MAIENFKEIQDYFETNKDSEDVKNYIGGLFTPDRVENFLNSDNGKKILQPKLDNYATKAINSHDEKFKANELPKLIDEAVKKANPAETADQKKIRELEAKFEQSQKDAARKDLTNKALKTMQTKKLPAELVDFFIADDEENTNKNLETLEKVFSENVNKIAQERLDSGYKPPKNNNTNLTAEQQAQAQINKIFGIK